MKGSSKAIMDWDITDFEIQDVERLLLPNGCHFADDAVQVIRHWDSVDVSACPGSGKTTVLLAKLKLLADRMPLENGAGICVLSHTNVAINEIKKRLTRYADTLMSYPNYVGTIQSFIDRFVTMPYIRRTVGQSVQPVDSRTYAHHMLQKMREPAYSTLSYAVKKNYENCRGIYADRVDHAMALYKRNDGALCIKNQTKALAGAGKKSAQQFSELKEDLLKDEGIILYQDAYQYANNAVEELSNQYTDLFSLRFRYVFIDEYQDCTEIQRNALHKLFDSSKCVVINIGDADQAIYNSDANDTIDWHPSKNSLSIASSNRYGQRIANILSPLCKDKSEIKSSLGEGATPILIIYDKDTISYVLGKFVSLLEEKCLCDTDGVYKVIGFIKKADSAGIKIGSYWAEFNGVDKRKNEFKYWGIIDDICIQLQQGKMYRAESLIRKLMCRLFHYAGVQNAKTGKEHTPLSLRTILKDKYSDMYAEHILELSQLIDYNRESVDEVVRATIDELLRNMSEDGKSIFGLVPAHFMEEPTINKETTNNNNVFIDPIRGRRIQFDTVHGVKGETHDATLYLETELKNGSDIGRVLYCYGVGKAGTSTLYDYSRKIVYVGMSRPRKLLCVAIQESTYKKSKDAFKEWEKVFLCKNGKIVG